MKELKLSYIIPFYNGDTSFVSLVQSIYATGLDETEFEIIVVDDNSSNPDSARWLVEYAQSCPNIRIEHHERNLRQGGAKNTGIRIAKGEYIAFADQDDKIPGDGIVRALQIATLKKVDMLACRYRYAYDNGKIVEFGWNVANGYEASGKEFCEQHFNASVCVCPWEYLYRRDFLLEQQHPYAEKVLLEASDWVEWHLIQAKKVAYCSELIYQWNVLEASTSHQRTACHAAAWVSLGYRKIIDSEKIREISPIFADKVKADGVHNIEGTMQRLWKTTGYTDFFPALGDDLLHELQMVDFSPRVKRMLRHPRLALCNLYLFGAPRRMMRDIRDKFLR